MSVKKILFVCMGNICRSPSAEAVFNQLIKDRGLSQFFEIDSAGTHSYHIGSQPDGRSIQAAKRRGIQMSHLRARQVIEDDYHRFDWLVVMDQENQHNLARMFPVMPQDKVIPMMRFAADAGYDEVPDPYYGAGDGFELVLDLLEQASQGLLEYLSDSEHKSL